MLQAAASSLNAAAERGEPRWYLLAIAEGEETFEAHSQAFRSQLNRLKMQNGRLISSEPVKHANVVSG